MLYRLRPKIEEVTQALQEEKLKYSFTRYFKCVIYLEKYLFLKSYQVVKLEEISLTEIMLRFKPKCNFYIYLFRSKSFLAR